MLLIFILRIKKETEIDIGNKIIRVGADISKANFFTIWLEIQDGYKYNQYNRVSLLLAKRLFASGSVKEKSISIALSKAKRCQIIDNISNEDIINSAVYQVLKYTTQNPKLAVFILLNYADITDNTKKSRFQNQQNS